MKLPRVYPILDAGVFAERGFSLTCAAAAFLQGGAGILQLRHKQHWGRAVFEAARSGRRARRWWYYIAAAVPIAATVAPAAPAAVMAASLRAMRRPATAWWPARWSSRTRNAASLS